ncbi:hypothetical protein NX794_30095 [Streptomyces sp. LP11]|uniref:Uncharacterized protein n=1 Tax=Streptomyces pyxinicus TaxID=2970331 RepID=A0ABT2BA75_9ACTN|nr:hypothetical protein [Streptomyces sp. LP11]MCS0605424.1 hypothetical protein [Streptomyces sp. LP11]
MSARRARTLVEEIEGHLLLTTARGEGRAAGERVAAQLGRLTDSQRDELERHVETAYLTLARTSWQRTAERAEELRRLYDDRYRALRLRLVAWYVLGCAALAATALLVVAA